MATFSTEVIRLAQESEEKYGVPASVTLAQYALESGYGTSNLAKTKNNYFGMKAGSKGWQSFSSMAESFDAHGKLLTKPIYADKTANATTAEEYIRAISETYAPSSDGNYGYADKIMKIINDNNLTQYDGDKWQDFTYTGSSSTGSSSSNSSGGGITGKLADIGNSILSAVIPALAIILIGVLAVIFFMTAFDMKLSNLPVPAAKVGKIAKKAKTASKVKDAAKAVKDNA